MSTAALTADGKGKVRSRVIEDQSIDPVPEKKKSNPIQDIVFNHNKFNICNTNNIRFSS